MRGKLSSITMKFKLATLALVAFVLPAIQEVRAATDVSIFYDNLSDGNWFEVADYGYVWQPQVAASNNNWRPYTDGYWASTDAGWTWVSYEDFGWATYHYGRWTNVADTGWVWVPGNEWGPAWVSWRTGSEQVGWAPLPPAADTVYEGHPISGHVDVDYDIGPSWYNFVDVQYIGEPVLLNHLYAPDQNLVYVNNSVNVTNIVYNNNIVVNNGPNLHGLAVAPLHKLPTLKLQHGAFANGAAGNGAFNKIQGGQLLVNTPMKLDKSAQLIAPKNVKAKLDHPKLERGWSGLKDPAQQAQLKEKFKSEDSNSFQGLKKLGGNGKLNADGRPIAVQGDVKAIKGNEQSGQDHKGNNATAKDQLKNSNSGGELGRGHKIRGAAKLNDENAENPGREHKVKPAENSSDGQGNGAGSGKAKSKRVQAYPEERGNAPQGGGDIHREGGGSGKHQKMGERQHVETAPSHSLGNTGGGPSPEGHGKGRKQEDPNKRKKGHFDPNAPSD